MSSPGSGPNPKVWGRRPYAGKESRELLNDVSRYIARERPDSVDDPDDPALSDIIRHAGGARTPDDSDAKAQTLIALMGHGLDFQEAVCWYWYRYCQFDVTDIHYAMSDCDEGGDPGQRRQSTRNILSVLRSAAATVPDADPDDIPSLVDEQTGGDEDDDT